MNDDERTTITTKNSKLLSAFLLLLLLFSTTTTTTATVTTMNMNLEKQKLLKQFGLEGVPLQSGPNVDIPKHVWDLYHDSDYEADWVRHYYPRDIMETHKGFMLSYNLSVAARAEQVIRAELKLRLHPNSTNVKVYYLDDVETLQLIENRSSILSEDHWVDFDVTAAAINHNNTIRFYIEGAELDQIASTSTISQLQYAKAQSAPLIVFSDEKWRRRRRRRSADTPNERKNRKKGKKHHVYDQSTSNNLCRKTELYVDFDELGWQDWIMAPKGYDAFQCQGSCPSVMPASLNASNHAIIQALLHSLNPEEVPPPCCVPTETSPLSILYMDTDNVIVIKEYADMRVESCGCR
ncbi:unnamed protein product [Caenorhabditis angaria]|uniref:TGF-beta family profile domain-containing protein n=1 Tax=Caenorhabditis angaria TaxID=860376 RepID=A0A9P1IV45_9PELO|nr:unnamed protein product [Caenorhabditis angaria]